MSTSQDLIDRIADEVDDADLATGGQILKAINSAIREYRDKRFWFNQVLNSTFALTAATEYLIPTLTVTGISTTEPLTVVDQMTIDDGTGANYREVVLADDSYIEACQTGAITGRPAYSSLVADATGTQIRFFPIPDQAYTPKIKALVRFTEFTDGMGDNPWTNDAETLIRQAAKRILMSDVTHELPPGSPPSPAELSAFADLQNTTRLRIGNVTLRADDLVALQGRGRWDVTNGTYR
jgi:hypothetical protein